ncbi:MAG: DUF3821 domain-containing protein [Methanomicrobiaceae archaeon]|nr:DUF3821 domain-containing protein [Methanomicrobiaceae archaeon]
MTSKKFGIALLSLLVLALLFLATPVSAKTVSDGLTNISAGDTVFLGEAGLNVSSAVPNAAGTICWYSYADAAPDVLTISDKNSFSITGASFAGKLGTWYNGSTKDSGNLAPANNVAFVVADPSLSNVLITDVTAANADVTGKSVIAGDVLKITYQTNLQTLITQRNLTGPMDLNDDHIAAGTGSGLICKVKTPDGAILNGLYGDNKLNGPGITIPLSNLTPVNSVYSILNTTNNMLSVWNTSYSAYPSGTYEVWFESSINDMDTYYGSITGKTISSVATVTIAKETVTITADKETVIRNNPFSVTIEGKPKTDYFVWIKGISTYNNKTGFADMAPYFTQNQKDVNPVNYQAAKLIVYSGTTTTIGSDVPVENGTIFWVVNATTSSSGTATISLSTDGNTKAAVYTIRAAKRTSDSAANDQLYDTVKVKVEKGAVTITASGDGSYYLGEEITISGTDTDTDNVYLFITGPNLPVNGGQITAPATAGTTMVNVKTDDTWEYKWSTSGVTLDAGTYTIYASSKNVQKDGLSEAKYDTVSIVIKKPFVTATTSASTVAKGDKLYIRGTAEGNPTQGVAIWVLGKNYWNGKTDLIAVTETVNDDGSFEYEMGTADTKDLASGQYFVVVQHPMYNDRFDVYSDAATPTRILTQLAGAAAQNSEFIIWGAGKLQGSDAAQALTDSIDSADIDDTYTKLTFLVEEPWIRINSVGDHYVGDVFKVSGTTNLAVDDDLIVEVTSSSFQPTQKTQSGEFSGVSQTVKVTSGDSYNEWAMDVDASTFKPDEYIVNVEAIEADCTATTTFNVLKGAAPTTSPGTPTTGPTTAPTTGPTTAPTPEPTASPGFGAFVALIGLGAVAALVMRKD